jgi:hypothetical protein
VIVSRLKGPSSTAVLTVKVHRIEVFSSNCFNFLHWARKENTGAYVDDIAPVSHPEIVGFQDVIKNKSKSTIFT